LGVAEGLGEREMEGGGLTLVLPLLPSFSLPKAEGIDVACELGLLGELVASSGCGLDGCGLAWNSKASRVDIAPKVFDKMTFEINFQLFEKFKLEDFRQLIRSRGVEVWHF
jgi:hypothetical protein